MIVRRLCRGATLNYPPFRARFRGARLALLALCSPAIWSFQDCPIAIADGLGLLTPQCLVSIDRLLDLSSFRLRYDLDEHGHDCTGPEGPTERVEQVSQESE